MGNLCSKASKDKEAEPPRPFYDPIRYDYAVYDIDGKSCLRHPSLIHQIPPHANVKVFPKHDKWTKNENPAYVHEKYSSSNSSLLPTFEGARVGTEKAYAGDIVDGLPHRQYNSVF